MMATAPRRGQLGGRSATAGPMTQVKELVKPGSLPAKFKESSEPKTDFGRTGTAYELEAQDLAPFARTLARNSSVGGDPNGTERAWQAVAFQTRGLAKRLSVQDAYTILRSMSQAGVLRSQREATSALTLILREGEPGVLSLEKVVSVWVALDRADILEDKAAQELFHRELPKSFPAEEALVVQNSDKEWKKALAIFSSSGCSPEGLLKLWKALEASMLADPAAARTLTALGLLAAIRTAVLVKERLAECLNPVLIYRLMERLLAQAPWLDGWCASHAVLASARLGAAPGQCYDVLRDTLLQRCSGLKPPQKLKEPDKKVTSDPQSVRNAEFVEAQRIAAALELNDVHDSEVRGRLSEWLLQPLPPQQLASLAGQLAAVGCTDISAPRIARHVRARARSSEVVGELGEEAAAGLLLAYAQGGAEAGTNGG